MEDKIIKINLYFKTKPHIFIWCDFLFALRGDIQTKF